MVQQQKKKKVQTISPLLENYEVLILFQNVTTEVNEFLPATAHIVYLIFNLNSGSDSNYRFSLSAKHCKTRYFFFFFYQKLANTKYKHRLA